MLKNPNLTIIMGLSKAIKSHHQRTPLFFRFIIRIHSVSNMISAMAAGICHFSVSIFAFNSGLLLEEFMLVNIIKY